MKRISHILLDMDGVLADFFTAALRRCNVGTDKYMLTPESYVGHFGFNMASAYGITDVEFWNLIDRDNFWAGLQPLPHAAQLIGALQATGLPIYISSSPSQGHDCVPAKICWLRTHFDLRLKDCMFGSAKHLMARPGALLIDDLPMNCNTFVTEGGSAVCVPSNWNKLDLTFADVWAPISETLNLP